MGEFGQNSRIRPKSTFEFEFRNLEYWNSSEFKRIRPSLQGTYLKGVCFYNAKA